MLIWTTAIEDYNVSLLVCIQVSILTGVGACELLTVLTIVILMRRTLQQVYPCHILVASVILVYEVL